MTRQFINCTPHVINMIQRDGQNVPFNPCGFVPRVDTTEEEVDFWCVPIVESDPGNVSGLPEFDSFRDNDKNVQILCIVSKMVLDAISLQDANDFAASNIFFVAPDTGKTAIRNDAGHIVGVTRIIRKKLI